MREDRRAPRQAFGASEIGDATLLRVSPGDEMPEGLFALLAWEHALVPPDRNSQGSWSALCRGIGSRSYRWTAELQGDAEVAGGGAGWQAAARAESATDRATAGRFRGRVIRRE